MSIDINAVPDAPYTTTAQKTWNTAIKSHSQAMDQASDAEKSQYEKLLYALQVFVQIKTPLDTDDRTAMGVRVGTKSAEQWASNKAMTAAIIQGLADSMGVTRDSLLDSLKTDNQTLPSEFEAARTAIANA